ncbi:MAG TPA: SBBP repeat-containing protein [Solirubrobacteraceae bacterium]
MTRSRTRILRLATPVLVAAGLLPAAAGAATPPAPSTFVASGNVAGPSSTFSEVTAVADCGGAPLTGGGTRLAQTTQTVTHNGIHVDGGFPSIDGATQSPDGGLTPTRWIAAGGAGGAVPDDAQTLAYGICLAAGPTATRVVVASTPGPSGTFQIVHATATCPSGTRLLSGGSRATPGTVGSLKPNGSFPSDPAGTPVLSGINPGSWTATGLNGGGGDQSNTTYAFALCATAGPLPTVTVVHAETPGPAPASTPGAVTATCPDGTALLGGGGLISDAFGLPGSQGDHLTGSYPSDPGGTPVASGVAASWTAASHTGGVASGSLTQTDAWALCASSAAAPAPPSGPAVPAAGRPPSIGGTPQTGRTLTGVHASWTNNPTGFTYRWLRCGYAGNACAAIAGAFGRTYKPTSADIGSRLRIRETAANAAGPGTPAVSPTTAAVRATRVTIAQIKALLERQIAPVGQATKIPATLVRGDTVLPFTGLEAGRAVVDWYLPPAAGMHAVVAAQGTRSFPGPEATTIDVRLTAAGNAALNAAKTLRLTATGTFRPTGRTTVTATRTFVLTRSVAVRAAVARLPLSFEPNVGQAAPGVSFVARGTGATIELTGTRAEIAVAGSSARRTPGVLSMRLAGAAPDHPIAGAGLLPGTVSYLIGRASTWHTRVPTYAQVVQPSVYPGIDVRYTGAGAGLEYDFDLAAGADPSRIAIDLSGAETVRIDSTGNLLVGLGAREVVQRAPAMYQLVGRARRTVRGGFRLLGPRRVGFDVGRYDRSEPLVIDPTIDFSTQLVGSAPGTGLGVAVDRAGDTYVTGETSSANFPTEHPLQARPGGTTQNAFIAKLDRSGVLVYATYLGGAGYTSGRGIAVDAAGDAYVTGATNSTDFPTTAGALQRSYGGGPFDAFVAKLDPAGTGLVYSTFLGDTHYDEGNAIALDPEDRAVVTGKTVSPQFPVLHPLAPHTSSGAFVTKLSRAGTRLVSSSVLGGTAAGNHGDSGFGVAVDREGNTYVTGETNDTGFPTKSPLQAAPGGGADAFVVKINAASTRLDYATYFGGSGDDVGRAIVADGDGNAYITGLTTSRDLPTASAIQAIDTSPPPGASAGFVAKLDPTGNALVFSSYLGGGGDDGAPGGDDGDSGIAIDRSRDVYVTGETSSTDFPLASPLQRTLHGPGDAFVTELDRSGSFLRFSTYFGGGGTDAGLAVAVDRSGAIHLTGSTDSTDFPRRGRRQPGPKRYAAPGDGAFVAVLRLAER